MSVAIFTSSFGERYATYLPAWVESMKALDPPADELVIVGDVAARDAYNSDPRGGVTFVFAPEYGAPFNQPAGFNAAMRAVTAEWAMHVGVDDFVYPDLVARLMEHAADADVVAVDVVSERDGQFVKLRENRPTARAILTPTMGRQALDACAMFRRSFWQDCPYDESFIAGGCDIALWIGFALAGARFTWTGTPGVRYQLHADSLWHSRPPRALHALRMRLNGLRPARSVRRVSTSRRPVITSRREPVSAEALTHHPDAALIPKRLFQVWVGSAAPPEQFSEWRARWIEMHPTWQHAFVSDRDSWFKAVLYPRLANRDLYDDAEALAGDHASQFRADLLRYELLLNWGGVYADLDMEPLRPIDDLLDGVEAFVGWEQQGVWANNAMMGARPGHPFLAGLVRGIRANIEMHRGQRQRLPRPNALSGPRYLTPLLNARDDVAVFAEHVFYPYGFADVGTARERGPFPASYAVHHWNNTRSRRSSSAEPRRRRAQTSDTFPRRVR